MIYEIKETQQYTKWFNSLKDTKTKARTLLRIKNVSRGHFGDHKPVDSDISELRFFFGGGLRVYYTIRDGQVVLLLSGGDKATQQKDIAKAKNIFINLE